MDDANGHLQEVRAGEGPPRWVWPVFGVLGFGLGFAFKEVAVAWWASGAAGSAPVLRSAVAGMVMGLVWGLGISWMSSRARSRRGGHAA